MKYCLIILIILFISCDENSDVINEQKEFSFLDSFPKTLPQIEYPEDNLPSKQRILLGKMLFSDKRLSRTNEIACASCHKPEYAFADNSRFSDGVEGRPGTRNSVSLMNVAYQKKLLREGGVPTIEMQALVPFQEHNEFDLNILEAAEKLKKDSVYSQLALQAYDRELDPFVITRAVSAFQRTLIGGNSKFDLYLNGQVDLTGSEKRGLGLFFSDSLACSSCHSGILFTSQDFANNGLYLEYEDEGKYRLTFEDQDKGVFKIPSLRNVSLTAPYMFDGSLETLDDVIEHYASGGKDHPNKDIRINGFHLTSQEKIDLINFLMALEEEVSK